MKALLVRVGIDSSDEGRWNGPVNTKSWSFAYVPIVETRAVRHGFKRFYDELRLCLEEFQRPLPDRLMRRRMHLDPDFEFLTYGDSGARANQISKLEPDDMLVFYAGLRDSTDHHAKLVYALIGLYVIREIVPATSVRKELWKRNAHTRRIPKPSDIVVRARRKVSGRFDRCVPIGEYRNGAYRVKKDVLKEWGGLAVKDGWLQRSARLPAFTDVNKFCRWFSKHNISLIESNNPSRAIGGCFQFFYASKPDVLRYPDVPTRDVLRRHKTEPHLEKRMENWCRCRAQNVTANVRQARDLHERGGQHYMILTTSHPNSRDSRAVGMLEFSVEDWRAAIHDFPRRWSEITYLPYVGSIRSKIVSWRDAFNLRPWMKKNGKEYLPGARYGIVAAPDSLLREIVDYLDGKKDQTVKFLKNIRQLERQLKKKDRNKWAHYWRRKTGAADMCATHKTTC